MGVESSAATSCKRSTPGGLGPAVACDGLGLGTAEEGQWPRPLLPSPAGAATSSVAAAEPPPREEGALTQEGNLEAALEVRSGRVSRAPTPARHLLVPCSLLRHPFSAPDPMAKPKHLSRSKKEKGKAGFHLEPLPWFSPLGASSLWCGRELPQRPLPTGCIDWGAGSCPSLLPPGKERSIWPISHVITCFGAGSRNAPSDQPGAHLGLELTELQLETETEPQPRADSADSAPPTWQLP